MKNEIIQLANSLLKQSESPLFVFSMTKIAVLPVVEEMDRLVRLREQFILSGNQLKLMNVMPDVFLSNILLIDSSMHKILAEMIIISMRDGIIALNELAKILEKENPLKLDQSFGQSYYINKIRLFLLALASGMRTNEVWLGIPKNQITKYEINDRGKLMSFTISQLQLLGDYLMNHSFINCKIEDQEDNILKIKMGINLRTCLEDNRPDSYDDDFDEELGLDNRDI